LIQNDKYLFEEIKAGNKKAFEQIFRIYYQDLCRFAMFLSCSPEDAEEIVQEMFFKLWQNHKSMTVPVAVKSYFYASVKNAVLNSIKHEKVKSACAQTKLSPEFDLDSSEIMENAESLKNIEYAINQLPEKRREIFIKCKIDGLKYKEIAEELMISVKTVENQMGEALKFLREKLSGKEFIFIILLSDFLINSEFIIGVFNNLVVFI
jgi:RNA polymerase sigma-70 factor, ECF subfamily